MKKIIMISLCWLGLLNASDLIIQEKMLNCAEIKEDANRLFCFDELAKAVKPDSKEILRAEILTQNCALCHGVRWDLPTKVGSQAVRHMKQEEIFRALQGYRAQSKGSKIMQNQVLHMSTKDLELISRYIANNVRIEQ